MTPTPAQIQTPLAEDDVVIVPFNMATSIHVLDNDSDPDAHTIMIEQVGTPQNGNASLDQDNTVTYSPNPDYIGPDQFTYSVMDGIDGSDTGNVYVTVQNPMPPVHHWPLDATSGTVAEDIQGGDHGALVNMDSTDWFAGVSSGSIRMDSPNSFVLIPTNLSPVLGGTASLAFWIRTSQSGNDLASLAPGLTGVDQSFGYNDIQWGWLDAHGHIGIQPGSGPAAKSTTPINDDIWHAITMTRDATTGELVVYVDGEVSTTTTSEIGNKTTPFSSLGRIESTGGTARHLGSVLDDIRIFNRVLSAGEVDSFYLSVISMDSDLDGEPDFIDHDDDTDNISDDDEWVAGTDASNASSVMEVECVESTNSEMSAVFNGIRGRVYRLQVCIDLESGVWTDVGDPMIGQDQQAWIQLPEPVEAAIYRLVVEHSP